MLRLFWGNRGSFRGLLFGVFHIRGYIGFYKERYGLQIAYSLLLIGTVSSSEYVLSQFSEICFEQGNVYYIFPQ